MRRYAQLTTMGRCVPLSVVRKKIMENKLDEIDITFEIGPTHTGLNSALQLAELSKKQVLTGLKFNF